MFVYKLEEHIFDETQGVLTRNGEAIPIEPQVAQVLGILLREAGETVSRDDLLREVWNSRSVSPGVVDNRIRAVRNALGDDGRTQRLIKTYSNQGYKFIGSVERVDEDSAAPDPEPESEPKPQVVPQRRPLWPWIGLTTAAAAVAVGLVVAQFTGRSTATEPALGVSQVAGQDVEALYNSVAVLPFMKNDAAELLGEKLPPLESLLVSKLASAPNLQVTSPRSSNRFSMVDMSAPVIGSALKTRHLVTGDVRATTDGTELILRLLDAQEDTVLWVETISLGADVDTLDMTSKEAMQSSALRVLNKLGVSPDPSEGGLISRDAAADFAQAAEILQLSRDNEIRTAIEYLEKVIAAEPDFLPAYEEIGMAYHLAARYSGLEVVEATGGIVKYAALAAQVSPSGRGLSMLRGLQAMYQGNLEVALSHLDEAIRQDASHKYSISLRAEVLSLLGDSIAAGQAFEHALAFDPLSPELMSQVARSKFGLQKHAEAIALARTNTLWNPGHPDAITDLGMFHRELGQYQLAYPMILKAMENKTNARAQFEMLLLLRSLGKLNLFDSFHMNPELNVLAYSLAGNEVLARFAQSRDPMGIYSGFMEYTFGNKRPFYEFLSTSGRYAHLTGPDAEISSLYLFDAVFYADASTEFAPDKTSNILLNLEKHFVRHPLEKLEAEEELLALAGLRSLQQDLPGLLAVMEAANNRKLVFVGTLKQSPVFEFARQSDAFLGALKRMEKQAENTWKYIQSMPNVIQ